MTAAILLWLLHATIVGVPVDLQIFSLQSCVLEDVLAIVTNWYEAYHCRRTCTALPTKGKSRIVKAPQQHPGQVRVAYEPHCMYFWVVVVQFKF